MGVRMGMGIDVDMAVESPLRWPHSVHLLHLPIRSKASPLGERPAAASEADHTLPPDDLGGLLKKRCRIGCRLCRGCAASRNHLENRSWCPVWTEFSGNALTLCTGRL